MSEPIDIESLDPLYRDVFRDPENGIPDSISSAGCLALAQLGKEAWNTWRSKYPTKKTPSGDWQNNADFYCHDFRVSKIDFSGFNFGNAANFNGTVFPQFASFNGALFGAEATFTGAQFASEASFKDCIFGQGARFNGTQFSNDATFENAIFDTGIRFVGLTWEQLGEYYSGRSGKVGKAKKWAEKRTLSPSTFKSICFDGTQFKGTVDFSNRTFLGLTTFNSVKKSVNTSFAVAPKFHNCKLHQDTSFEGADFPSPAGSADAIRAYRTLKLAFSQQQALREEQRFFRLEMAEEAARATGAPRLLYRAYAFLSDYGYSLARPAMLLVGTLLAMTLIYSGLSYAGKCTPLVTSCNTYAASIEFGILQSLPFLGLDKFSDPIRAVLFPSEGLISTLATLAMVLHKAIALLALFLMGLALRNLFKLK